MTLTATVTPFAVAGPPPVVVGSVQFQEGTANIGDPVTIIDGTASITTSTLTVGSHELTTRFIPPPGAAPSTALGNLLVFTVYPPIGAQATTTTLTTSPAGPVDTGTSVTLNAAVSPMAAGSVQFKDGDNTIGTSMTVTNGAASTATSSFAVGSHQLTAVFTPADGTAFSPSTSPTVTFMVNASTMPTATTTTLQVAPNPGFTFFPEILTAQVAPFDAAGTVQFLDGTTPVGSPVPLFAGFAWRITPLPAGTHTLTAIFLPPNLGIGGCATTVGFDGSTPLPCPPSDGFMPSASAPVSLTVQSLFDGLDFWVTPPHGAR